MKIIEVDEELYQYIAGKTQSIGESASDILRRLLNLPHHAISQNDVFDSEGSSQISKNKEHSASVFVEKKMEISQQKVKSVESQRAVKKQSDEAISHIVDKVRTLLNSPDFKAETPAVVRFLSILRILYRTNPESFALATESLQGRTRVYFARDEATLLVAGNHTKPKQIPDTPYWVITNTNSARKMLMLESAMQSMHLPECLIDEVRPCFINN